MVSLRNFGDYEFRLLGDLTRSTGQSSATRKTATEMQSFLRQFNILLWKCYLLKKRHWIATLFEFFLPLLTSIIMVITVSSFHPGKANTKSDSGYQKGPTVYNTSVFDLNLNLNLLLELKLEINFLIAPNSTCTDRFMDEFREELNSRLIGPPSSLSYTTFKNKEELDLYFSNFKGRFIERVRSNFRIQRFQTVSRLTSFDFRSRRFQHLDRHRNSVQQRVRR